MYEWHRQIQTIIEEIDASIRRQDDEALTLHHLAKSLGYSDFHMTKKFHEITGLSLRTYLRARRLAFALVEVRDTDRRLLDIALDYGFSSHEAFTAPSRRNTASPLRPIAASPLPSRFAPASLPLTATHSAWRKSA